MTSFGYKLDVSSLFQICNRSLGMERAIHVFSCGSCYCSDSIIPSLEYILSPLLKTRGWLVFRSSVPGAPLRPWSSWHSDPSALFQGKHSLDHLLCKKSFFAGVFAVFLRMSFISNSAFFYVMKKIVHYIPLDTSLVFCSVILLLSRLCWKYILGPRVTFAFLHLDCVYYSL